MKTEQYMIGCKTVCNTKYIMCECGDPTAQSSKQRQHVLDNLVV